MDGTQLVKVARNMFNLAPNDPISVDQLNYVLQMSKPSNYIAAHHKIKGNPITFSVPNYDTSHALGHRTYQIGILNDLSQSVVVQKARQLGLSELGIEQMIYWLDMHSYDRATGLYTFPTYRQLQDFLKQRLFPEFESGYYKTLIKNAKEMTQNMMKIRDSSLVFRTSSQGSSMEGLQVDFLSLDNNLFYWLGITNKNSPKRAKKTGKKALKR